MNKIKFEAFFLYFLYFQNSKTNQTFFYNLPFAVVIYIAFEQN